MNSNNLQAFQTWYKKGYEEGFREGQKLFKQQVLNKMKENDLLFKEITSIKVKEADRL